MYQSIANFCLLSSSLHIEQQTKKKPKHGVWTEGSPVPVTGKVEASNQESFQKVIDWWQNLPGSCDYT